MQLSGDKHKNQIWAKAREFSVSFLSPG